MWSNFYNRSLSLTFALILLACNIVTNNAISVSPLKTFAKISSGSLLQSISAKPHVDPSQPVKLPWNESIQSSRTLSYMPMLQNQLNLMKSHNIESLPTDEKFAYKSSELKPARISSMTFKSSIFRKIRLTYFDGGDSVQVLNSLWYPDYCYDLPMLGIDLISLGKSRVLSVIDLQPLHPTTEYSDKYIAPLKNIRDKYPDLQGTLSGKIYDDTSFFSKNLLFGRFTDESKLHNIVEPAMNEYLEYYLNLAENAVPNKSDESIKIVSERQKQYDIYSASKDPAVGLFDAYFGKEWSSSFVHDFLFELSSNPTANYEAPIHNFKINS